MITSLALGPGPPSAPFAQALHICVHVSVYIHPYSLSIITISMNLVVYLWLSLYTYMSSCVGNIYTHTHKILFTSL